MPGHTEKTPITNLIECNPSTLTIRANSPDREEFIQINLSTPNESCQVAWKIKTNKPGRYMVSPKQGFLGKGMIKQVTIVLNQLGRDAWNELNDGSSSSESKSKSSDKFLIQATRIDLDVDSNQIDLSRLWRERERLHDRRKGIYAYQALTVKCHVTRPAQSMAIPESITNGHPSNNQTRTGRPSDHPTVQISRVKENQSQKMDSHTFVDNYMDTASSHSRPTSSAAAAAAVSSRTNRETLGEELVTDESDSDSTESASSHPSRESTPEITQKKTKRLSPENVRIGERVYPLKTIKEWQKQSEAYAELVEYARKTLSQRDQLAAELRGKQELIRKLRRENNQLKMNGIDEKSEENGSIPGIIEPIMDDDDDEDDEKENRKGFKTLKSFENKFNSNRTNGSMTLFSTTGIFYLCVLILVGFFCFQIGQRTSMGDYTESEEVENSQKQSVEL